MIEDEDHVSSEIESIEDIKLKWFMESIQPEVEYRHNKAPKLVI
jgi:hypothetical protein